jgi:hypothetical protein
MSSSALVGATSARSGQSVLPLVLRIVPGMQRACRAAEIMQPLGGSRDLVRHHPSRVPALQASASEIPTFDSRLLFLVNSPILLVGRRR